MTLPEQLAHHPQVACRTAPEHERFVGCVRRMFDPAERHLRVILVGAERGAGGDALPPTTTSCRCWSKPSQLRGLYAADGAPLSRSGALGGYEPRQEPLLEPLLEPLWILSHASHVSLGWTL